MKKTSGFKKSMSQEMYQKKDLHVNESEKQPLKEFWNTSIPSTARGYGNNPAGAFLPRPGKDRAQPHQMINECDH